MSTNYYVTITPDTPVFSIDTGLKAEIFDAEGNHSIKIASGASVELKGINGENTFTIAENLASISAKLDGSVAVLTTSSGNEIRVPFSGSSQSIVFNDGTASLAINGGSPQLGNTTLTTTSISGSSILSSLGGTGISTQALTGGTQQTSATFDAGTGSFKFTDDLAAASFVDISNFGADDSIVYATGATVAVSGSGQDVTLLVNSAGIVNEISLLGVNTGSAFIADVAGFNALAVGDISFDSSFSIT